MDIFRQGQLSYYTGKVRPQVAYISVHYARNIRFMTKRGLADSLEDWRILAVMGARVKQHSLPYERALSMCCAVRGHGCPEYGLDDLCVALRLGGAKGG